MPARWCSPLGRARMAAPRRIPGTGNSCDVRHPRALTLQTCPRPVRECAPTDSRGPGQATAGGWRWGIASSSTTLARDGEYGTRIRSRQTHCVPCRPATLRDGSPSSAKRSDAGSPPFRPTGITPAGISSSTGARGRCESGDPCAKSLQRGFVTLLSVVPSHRAASPNSAITESTETSTGTHRELQLRRVFFRFFGELGDCLTPAAVPKRPRTAGNRDTAPNNNTNYANCALARRARLSRNSTVSLGLHAEDCAAPGAIRAIRVVIRVIWQFGRPWRPSPRSFPGIPDDPCKSTCSCSSCESLWMSGCPL